jgi:hypothetical protein
MKIDAVVEVLLDAVAIEQALITDEKRMGGKRIFLVLAATYAHPDVISLKLFCDRTGHWLGYVHHKDLPEGAVKVMLRIRPKTDNKLKADECGL